jgi:hypothetical protein
MVAPVTHVLGQHHSLQVLAARLAAVYRLNAPHQYLTMKAADAKVAATSNRSLVVEQVALA